MTRLTLLFVVAALVMPGVASATPTPDARARAIEAYYSSYGEPQPIAASEPAPVADDHTGPSWFGALGIGVALMLIAGSLGVYAGRSVHPRRIGA